MAWRKSGKSLLKFWWNYIFNWRASGEFPQVRLSQTSVEVYFVALHVSLNLEKKGNMKFSSSIFTRTVFKWFPSFPAINRFCFQLSRSSINGNDEIKHDLLSVLKSLIGVISFSMIFPRLIVNKSLSMTL